MAYSKVILNGTTLMDVTQKTVAADKLLSGYTALKNDGTGITGTYSGGGGGGGSHTITVVLENPISASFFSYCKIYEWDGNDTTLGQQVGEITSPTGRTTITTSANGIVVLLSGDYVTPPKDVGTQVWCTGLIGLAYATEGEPARMYFAIGGDSETDIAGIDWSD